MNDGEMTVLGIAAQITFGFLVVGMACAFVRVIRGPSLPDRVVGLDLLTVLMVAFAGVFAVAAGEDAFIDVALALALVGFIATLAFARYAERRMTQDAACGKEGEEKERPGCRTS